MILRIVKIGIPLLAVVVSGFFLKKQGHPYSLLAFNIHKLVALGVFIAMLVISIGYMKATGFNMMQILLFSGFIIMFLAMFATGGVLSVMADPPGFVTILHKLLPYATIGLTLAVLLSIPLTGIRS